MHKKAILIFLISLNVASLFCTSAILLYQNFLHELATEFSSNDTPLTCVEISLSKYRSLNFSDLDETVKEVEIQGELMDVYKIDIQKSSVKLFVKLDDNDTDAKELLQKINHQNSNPKKSICSFFFYGMNFEKSSLIKFYSPEISIISCYYLLQIIPAPFIETTTQPPDLI